MKSSNRANRQISVKWITGLDNGFGLVKRYHKKKYYKYFYIKEIVFLVYLHGIEKYKRRKRRSNISIVLLLCV